MSAHKKKPKVTTMLSGVVVGNGRNHRLRFKIGLLLGVIALLVVAVGYLTVTVLNHRNTANKATIATKKQAQKTVQNSISYAANPAKLKTDSTTVINGGVTSDVSKAQLAQAYVARGDAESNSKEYAAANADYTKAEQLDATLTESLQYRQFYVRYKNGERKTLIPLLQQMVKSLDGSDDDFAPSIKANYQQYIQDLQAGKDLQL